MKLFFGVSAFIVLGAFLLFQGSVSSCTKEKLVIDKDTVTVTVSDTITVTIRDTTILPDYPITSQLITANSWKVYEERGVAGGAIVYYLRGGSSNTQNLDNEYITFNANGTGTWVHNSGATVNISWVFANAQNTKLVWTAMNTPATFNITWDNIRYKNNMLYFDQYYTDGNLGFNSHSQQIRMPR